jgi:hypothetical protein
MTDWIEPARPDRPVPMLTAQMVERSEEFTFADQREITLKGLSRPQSVARLVWPD